MTIPYQEIFAQAEATLLTYGAQHLPLTEIRAALDHFKTFADRCLSDDEYYSILTDIVFYSGFRAATVSAKQSIIHRHFPGWKTVAGYEAGDIARIMNDPEMIRNRRKIEACVRNARVFSELIQAHGSFEAYLKSFRATESTANIVRLKRDLQSRFGFLGGITVYHFLTDIGLPVLKPDRVVTRMFERLGLIDDPTDLQATVEQGRAFAAATGLPIRYIDIVFVALGQVQSLEFGVDRGICLKEPRCNRCGLTKHCKYYQSRQPVG